MPARTLGALCTGAECVAAQSPCSTPIPTSLSGSGGGLATGSPGLLKIPQMTVWKTEGTMLKEGKLQPPFPVLENVSLCPGGGRRRLPSSS